ncbi:MAG: EAL domain-containing protein [Acidovorax sp.]|nr:EAL domain-containing protein [Acidovorax sp.]
MPLSEETPKTPWQARSVYLRVFVPLLLVILAVSAVRYHYMVESEVTAAHERAQAEATRIGSALLTALKRLPPDQPEKAQRVLEDSTVYFASSLFTVQWQVQGRTGVSAQKPPGTPDAPAWFAKWANVQPPTLELSETLPDGTVAHLKIALQSHVLVDQIWDNLQVQSGISLFNVVFVLTLLAWLVHQHVGLVRRLLHAHRQLQRGHLTARMQERGSPSERAVAQSFNATALQLQTQVQGQKDRLQRQAQQLELAQLLIEAAPLPVTVRRSDGVCLDVREEWQRLFQSPLPMAAAEAQPAALPQPSLALPAQTPPTPDALPTPPKPPAAPIPGTIGTLVTASDRLRTQQALSQAQQAHTAAPHLPGGDAIITTDLHGTIETINETAQFLTGYKVHQAMGRPLEEVFRLADALHPQRNTDATDAAEAATLADSPPRTHPILIHRSGERYAIEYTASTIRKSNGVAVGCVLVFHDVSESRHFRHQVSWQSHHDALTGLHNRAALAESLTHALFTAQQQGTLLAVCMIDLDHFQRLNQQHGSATGDRALREVAQRLRAFAGPHDAVARMAGDEFVLLLGQQPHLQAIEARTAQLLEQLGQPCAIDALQLRITASMGVAVYPQLQACPSTLLRQADQAMCQAKQAGRQQVRFFDAQSDAALQTPHTQQTRIAQALRTGEMRLHYQPQVNLANGQIVAVEALLRWQHPERGLQGPEQILPLIDDADLAAELGEWVLTEALAQLRLWHAQGLDWTVGVNVATQHLLRSNFAARLQDLLALFAPLPAHLLQLEVQESAGLHEPQALQALMQHCHQTLGVRWAVDDFGIGKATLAWVAQVPADTLKIDRSIADAVLHSTEDAAVVSTAVAMAQALGHTLVAEGAESPAHCTRLRELGCQVVQGYAIAHPMPGGEVADWARSYRRSVASTLVLP